MQVAILDNKVVYADDALYEYGKNKSYVCLYCGEKVILKIGDIKEITKLFKIMRR